MRLWNLIIHRLVWRWKQHWHISSELTQSTRSCFRWTTWEKCLHPSQYFCIMPDECARSGAWGGCQHRVSRACLEVLSTIQWFNPARTLQKALAIAEDDLMLVLIIISWLRTRCEYWGCFHSTNPGKDLDSKLAEPVFEPNHFLFLNYIPSKSLLGWRDG